MRRLHRVRSTPILLLALAVAGCPSRAEEAGGRPGGASPERTFDAETHVFVSTDRPALRLRLPDSFRYLGRLEFPLGGRSWVDRHLFAEVQGQEIRRLIVLQFEGFLDGVEGRYGFQIPAGDAIAGGNYRFSPERVRLGQHEYVHNTWAFDHAANAAENPDFEADRMLRYLESRGWRLDAGLIMSRFVREVGEERRDELILFYMMPLSAAGRSLAEFPEGSPPSPAYDELSETVTRESLAAFHFLDG